MSRGGWRPGSGRKKGQKNTKPMRPRRPSEKSQAAIEREQIRKLLATGTKAKAKIYQDFLVRMSNKGSDGQPLNLPPLTMPEKALMIKLGAELAAEVKEEDREELKERLDPLEYALAIVSDPREDKERRDRLAVAILPYLHARKGEGIGKKEEKADRAKSAGSGKFSPGAAPLRVVK